MSLGLAISMALSSLPIGVGAGLPAPQTAALVDSEQVSVTYQLQSNANDSGFSNNRLSETLLIDGETQAINLAYAKRINQNWEINANISSYRHSAGRLDSLIDNWHSAFGLDEGDRPLFDENQLSFVYENNGVRREINSRQTGLGDLQLGFARQLFSNKKSQASLRGVLTLPTGSDEKLTGSEKADFALSFHVGQNSIARNKRFSWLGEMGFLAIGDDSLFGIKTKSGSAFAALTISWKLKNAVSLYSQFNGNTALFESSIPELSKSALQLTLGVKVNSSSNKHWQIYFSEDINVNRSPDFAFGINRLVNF